MKRKSWLLLGVCLAVCSLPIWTLERLTHVFVAVALAGGSVLICKFVRACDEARTGQGR